MPQVRAELLQYCHSRSARRKPIPWLLLGGLIGGTAALAQVNAPRSSREAPYSKTTDLYPSWLSLRFGAPELPDYWFLSPDRKRLTTILSNGPVTVWDTEKRIRVSRLDCVSGKTVAANANLGLILTEQESGKYRAVELPSGRTRWEIQARGVQYWHLTDQEVQAVSHTDFLRWDIRSGKLLGATPYAPPAGLSPYSLNAITGSAAPRFLVFSYPRLLRLWDREQAAFVADLPVTEHANAGAHLTDDGRYLLLSENIPGPYPEREHGIFPYRTAPNSNIILDPIPQRFKLMEVASGRVLWTHDWPGEVSYGITLQNGRVLIRGRKTSLAWDLLDGHDVPVPPVAKPQEVDVDFSPEELVLELRMRGDFRRIGIIPPGPFKIQDAQWSPDGRYLLTVDHGLTRWDLETARVEQAAPKPDPGRISVQTDGLIAVEGQRHVDLLDPRTFGTVRRFEPPTWYQTRDKRLFRDAGQMKASPDGRYFLVASASGAEWARTGELQIWREHGRLPWTTIRYFGGHIWADYAGNLLQQCAFVPNRSAIVTPGLYAGESGLRLFDLQTGRLTHVFRHPDRPRIQLVIAGVSPDGHYLAGTPLSPPADCQSVLWDIRTGEPVDNIPNPSAAKISFSPDGKWLAVGQQVFRFNSQRGIVTGPPHTLPVPGRIVWSPDRKRFAVITDEADSRVVIFGTHLKPLASLYRTREPSESGGPYAGAGWLCLTPEGFFNASPNAVDLVALTDGSGNTDNRLKRLYNPAMVRRTLQVPEFTTEAQRFWRGSEGEVRGWVRQRPFLLAIPFRLPLTKISVPLW